MNHEQIDSRIQRRLRHPHSGLFMGIVVVAIGVLLLLSNMGILRAHEIWEFWPVLLIVFGLSKIFEACSPSGRIFGGFIAVIGALWLAENLNLFYIRFDFVWPLILIAFGLSMLWKGVYGRRVAAGKASAETDAPVTSFVMFSGSRRRIDSENFTGGQLSAMFGGIELDLRRARITQDKAVIDATSMFGGIEITVPDEWTVSVTGMGIFGGFEDKTHPPKPVAGVAPQNLEVTGTAMFGGVSVRN